MSNDTQKSVEERARLERAQIWLEDVDWYNHPDLELADFAAAETAELTARLESCEAELANLSADRVELRAALRELVLAVERYERNPSLHTRLDIAQAKEKAGRLY